MMKLYLVAEQICLLALPKRILVRNSIWYQERCSDSCIINLLTPKYVWWSKNSANLGLYTEFAGRFRYRLKSLSQLLWSASLSHFLLFTASKSLGIKNPMNFTHTPSLKIVYFLSLKSLMSLSPKDGMFQFRGNYITTYFSNS